MFASGDADEVVAEFQGQLHLLFAKAKLLWRESAAQIDAELSPAAYKLLTYVAREGTANAHQLSEAFEMDKSFVSRQVRVLEDLGLIHSRPDEHDGRLRVLTATPDALARLAVVRADYGVRMRSVLAQLTPDELRIASKVFQVVSAI